MNNYFNYKKKENNILLTNHKSKAFLNNKRSSSPKEEDNKLKINNFNNKNNMIVLSKDGNGIFNKYMYYKYKADKIKNIYYKNLLPKYICLSIYISKNENEDNYLQIIQNIKDIFIKYIISYKNKSEDIFMKIKFCGNVSKPKLVLKNIKYLMKTLLKEKSLVKIYLYSNLKECLNKVINQININNESNNGKTLYDYYTSNINTTYLKEFINN